jgi:hypothetical protein
MEKQPCNVLSPVYGNTINPQPQLTAKAGGFPSQENLPASCHSPLSHLKCGALRMAGIRRSVSGNADMVRLAVTVSVIYTVYSLAVNLQPTFRCLKQVMKRSVLVLVETSAAGFAAVFCLASVYNNCLLAAVMI